MRIVAGAHRGRTLVAPKGQSTRPTSDRARQALFDVLEHAPWAGGLGGRRIIDLYAGSGALGLEALSRGVDFCLFVERAAEARAVIAANVRDLGAGDRVRIEGWDARTLPRRLAADGAAFDLAFLDPPYGTALALPALASLAAGGWLAKDALCVVEQGEEEPFRAPAGFAVADERKWGAARVWFVRAPR